MSNDVSIHSVVTYDNSKYLGEMFGTSAVCDVSFSIKYAWEHMLLKEVFEYHNLIFRECNVPVDLQMGTILPFVASCLGPNTKGLFLT